MRTETNAIAMMVSLAWPGVGCDGGSNAAPKGNFATNTDSGSVPTIRVGGGPDLDASCHSE